MKIDFPDGDKYEFTGPARELLAAGFPIWMIAAHVLKHLEGLRMLPADTPEVLEAIAANEAFLAELQSKQGDQ